MLSFDGETAPYVQYAYARAKSIIRKAGKVEGNADYSKLNSKEEFELAKSLEDFNNVVLNAIDKLEPSIVTRYAVEVAKNFNKFYNAHTVLNVEEQGLKVARLKLIEAAAQVIKNSLALIGVEVSRGNVKKRGYLASFFLLEQLELHPEQLHCPFADFFKFLNIINPTDRIINPVIIYSIICSSPY